jgi:hypothetical protein
MPPVASAWPSAPTTQGSTRCRRASSSSGIWPATGASSKIVNEADRDAFFQIRPEPMDPRDLPGLPAPDADAVAYLPRGRTALRFLDTHRHEVGPSLAHATTAVSWRPRDFATLAVASLVKAVRLVDRRSGKVVAERQMDAVSTAIGFTGRGDRLVVGLNITQVIGVALRVRGLAAFDDGNPSEPLQLWEKAAAIQKAGGDRWQESVVEGLAGQTASPPRLGSSGR